MDRLTEVLFISFWTLRKKEVRRLLQEQTELFCMENPDFRPLLRLVKAKKDVLVHDLVSVVCARLSYDLSL